jgi:ATP-binding cassette subfamily F protein 1
MQDISIDIPTLVVGSKELLTDTKCVIAIGHKYGLVGLNGTGKTSLLKFLNEHSNITKYKHLLVSQEGITGDKNKTVFDTILESNMELLILHRKFKNLLVELNNINDTDESNPTYDLVFKEYTKTNEKLTELEWEKEESLIRRILSGLGFKDRMDEPIKNFSGGWQMRVALAAALYRNPDILFLDEPTNHLDLEANIWLTNYLQEFNKTLIVISHNIDFLNEVCSDIINIANNKLDYYKGNYSRFRTAYEQKIKEIQGIIEKEEKKMKEWKISQHKTKDQIEEYLKKNPLPQLPPNYNVRIKFNNIPNDLHSLIELKDLYYSHDPEEEDFEKYLFKKVNVKIYPKSRITFVGKNGIGKSTLLKILTGEIEYDEDCYIRDSRVVVGYYDQHTAEKLPEDLTPIEYLKSINFDLKDWQIREYLGKICLDGKHHTKKIGELSGGQKARISLCELQIKKPHVLVLDEPTNHLDIYTIEALIDAINDYNGAVIIVTHDSKLITGSDCVVYEINNKNLNEIEYDKYFRRILLENSE